MPENSGAEAGDRPTPVSPVWATVPTVRTVLLVVHNVTALNRLLDVVDTVAADLRVQCLVTSDLEDPFADGLPEQVAALGLVAVPWAQVPALPVDLVLSAGHHGDLSALAAPVVVLPHGSGFGKYAPGEDPSAGAGERTVYGLAPQWLLRGGRPAATAFVLPHADQAACVAAQAPAALPAAVVAGDPCYDRLLISGPSRSAYRAALGVGPRQQVVLVTSTWSRASVLGSWPDLIPRLVAELPPDDYRVVLVVHPNVWSWHGAFQLRRWWGDCLRAGLVLVPPLHGWQAALVAADCVIGDHGSVTTYAAALGRPTLLAAFPDDDVVPGSAIHRVGQLAARLDPDRPLRDEIEAARADAAPTRFADVAGLVTSVPGQAYPRLSELFYRLLRLSAPQVVAAPQPFTCDGLAAPGSPARMVLSTDALRPRIGA